MPAQHVLIIGAGVCGLAIAHGLKKAGISYTIFEAEETDAFRPREWTMALHWSIPMLESLLADDLVSRWKMEAAVDKHLDYSKPPNNTISVFDGLDGSVLREIAVESDYLRVSRRKLRAFCHNGITVQYGHRLTGITYGEDGTVTASFANGARHSGTLLVGSDGPRSHVRSHLFGTEFAESTPLGVVYLNVAFAYLDAEKARFVRNSNPVTAFAVHPEMNCFTAIQDVPDPEKPETWRFQLVVTWKGERQEDASNQEKQKEVKEKGQRLAEPFRSAIQWMPDDVKIQYSDIGVFIPKPWDTENGRVVLAGDAAHSMPPNRGQGLNHAINDAFNFVAAVKKIEGGEDQGDLIKTYCDEVVERGAKEVRLSKEMALLMLDYPKYKASGITRHDLKKS